MPDRKRSLPEGRCHMPSRRLTILVLLCTLVVGCAGSAQKINHLNVGMTKADVIQVMGEPDYTSGREGVEILSYRLNASSFYSDTFYVRIIDGKVERFGRQGDFGIY